MMDRSGSAVVLLLLCCSLTAAAQTAPADTPLLIPPTVYVGDRARLIVPVDELLGGSGSKAALMDVADRLPRTADVIIRRVELQHVSGKSQVLIDFSPYAVGAVALPPITIGSYSLKDLKVQVASVLESEGTATLSPQADGLAVPGTAAMVFAGLLAILTVILVPALVLYHGRRRFRQFRERRRRNLALRSLRRVLARLGSADADTGADALAILCAELRSYLTYRCSFNCLVLTPKEFLAVDENTSIPDAGPFLFKLFGRLDEARFGGAPLAPREFSELLAEVSRFVEGLEATP